MGAPLVGIMCEVDEVDGKMSQMGYDDGGMLGKMRGVIVRFQSTCTTWSPRKGVLF